MGNHPAVNCRVSVGCPFGTKPRHLRAVGAIRGQGCRAAAWFVRGARMDRQGACPTQSDGTRVAGGLDCALRSCGGILKAGSEGAEEKDLKDLMDLKDR